MRGSIISILMGSEYAWLAEMWRGSCCAVRLGLTLRFLLDRINCVVQIDPTFELEGLPVGENWRGPGKCCV